MSEEKATYSSGSELTFHSLVNDLDKLRSAQEHIQQQLQEVARAYPGLTREEHFQQIDVKIMMVLVNFDDVIREYQNKNEQAEKIAKYNRELDEHTRIIMESREKPWLPFHDGE